MEKKSVSPELKKVYNLYALFGVAMLLSVLPFFSAALLCVIFFIWILIAAYVERGRAEEDSLVHNHAVYIIRTLWIAALVSVVSMIAASAYMLGRIDYTLFQPCADKLAGMDPATLEGMGMSGIYPLVEPCVEPFLTFNAAALFSAAVIGLAPPMIYLVYRYFKGVLRAVKGYRLADPKHWF